MSKVNVQTTPERMTVTVRDRRPENSYNYGPFLKTVTIGTHCPECGERRGEPVWQSYWEDGEPYAVHNWDNPCGHVDMYADVLREAEALEGREQS